MKYLVDTDWLVDYLRSQPQAVQLFATLLAEERIAISLVTYGEVYDDIYSEQRAGC